MKTLTALMSHNSLRNTGKPTRLCLGKIATPYHVFRDACVEVRSTLPNHSTERRPDNANVG